ncbi:hypothetical protein ACFSUD_00475 [Sulfitobacter aestuarii]|uniref:Uncharacterized protein n=1 Tax=Sulfitobacter aestuarii TaxID=2161676 RepID=A0ABW5TXM2_9RHOB
MLAEEYASTLMHHWKEWHPKRYRRLVKSGTLEMEAHRRGRRIAETVVQLMGQGMNCLEAQEIVRDDLYPPPESDD